jgi:hypothetical protein
MRYSGERKVLKKCTTPWANAVCLAVGTGWTEFESVTRTVAQLIERDMTVTHRDLSAAGERLPWTCRSEGFGGPPLWEGK